MNTENSMKKALPIFLLILTMLAWAVNFHVVKIALQYYSPMGVAAIRFLFGVAVLVALMLARSGIRKLKFSRKDWGNIFLASFFGIFLTIYFFNLGLKTASAVNGSLIIATSPLIIAIFAFFFMNKKLRVIQILAIFMSFLGVAIIIVKGDVLGLRNIQLDIGDFYILCMAIVFSFSQIIVSKYLTKIDAIVMTTVGSLMALIMFTMASFTEISSTPLPSDFAFWGSILYMGVFGTAVAYTAFYYCVVKVGATTSTLYMNLIPFFAVLLAFPFGERLVLNQLVGGAIIVAALIIYNRSQQPHFEKK